MQGQVARVFTCGVLSRMASDQILQATDSARLLESHKLTVLGLSGMKEQVQHKEKSEE